ncbi:MAG: DUF1045 domain-containing protein [Pseudomonadales bacterium]|jgi:hypothetical protein|nr:DUF1045 domain-containing protein [Pseudomonadales bacterium]
MNGYARYALYFAPDPESELWRRGSAWLGRDAATGHALPRMPVPALDGLNLDRLTAAPRFYGFHGTLRAPFEPVGRDTEPRLVAAVDAFCAAWEPFAVPFVVDAIGDFVALRPRSRSPELQALHEACLHACEPFRAPLGAEDLARRRQARLSPRQDALLERWGYPYVEEEFRFHVTLSSRIAGTSTFERVRGALRELFADLLARPLPVEGLGLFAQASRDAPFVLLHWARFRGAAAPAADARWG